MIAVNLKGVVQQYDFKQVRRQNKKQMRRFLFQAGGFIRTTARRSLRKARKIRRSELPDDAREEFDEQMTAWKEGRRLQKPRLRDIVSSPGEPPLLHMNRSPLRDRLVFAVDEENAVVTVGPERAKDGIAGDLEFGRGDIKKPRPFMGPAYETFLPRLPETLRKAF